MRVKSIRIGSAHDTGNIRITRSIAAQNDEAVSGSARCSGLSSDDRDSCGSTYILVRSDEQIGAPNGLIYVFSVGVLVNSLILGAGYDLNEFLVFDAFAEYQIQVVCRGLVIVCIQSVGIGKMSIGCTEFISPFVHHLAEMRNIAAYMDRNGICNVICRIHEHKMKGLVHGHGITYLAGKDLLVIGKTGNLRAQCDLFIHGAVL